MLTEKCIICNNLSEYYFTKRFPEPYSNLLKESAFYKCTNCGFTNSDTIFTMDKFEWIRLNAKFHELLEDKSFDEDINQPPYQHQAFLIKILQANGLISPEGYMDYAGGHGTLSKIMMKYFNISIPVYDPYVKDLNSSKIIYSDNPNPKSVDVLINSALFEHIRSREDLDHVNSLVADDGVLILHTLICENIPKDPNWFYLVPPVHSALHTNKSMSLLMQDWGYKSSVYCPEAKCWVLFKKKIENIDSKIDKINGEFQSNYLYLKEKGFMDFWKGF